MVKVFNVFINSHSCPCPADANYVIGFIIQNYVTESIFM